MHNAPLTAAEASQLVKRFTLQSMYAKLLLDMFLCGVLTMQLVHYIRNCRDRRWVIATVACSCFLTYFISGYIVRYVSNLFVDQFGHKIEHLSTYTLAWYPLLDSMTSAIVQGFFAYRCWRITRSKIITGLLVLLIVGSVVAGCTVTWRVYTIGTNLRILEARPAIIIWLVSTLLADIVITSAILYGLLKNRTGWEHTDMVIKRLVRMTLEAQIPPTFMASAFLVVYFIAPRSVLNLLWQGIQSKFYVIGLLYSLNSREEFRARNLTMVGDESDAAVITVAVEVETFEARMESNWDKSTPNRPVGDEEANTRGQGMGGGVA